MNRFYSLLIPLLLAICFADSLSAQFYVTEREFYPTGVSNGGVVVGSTGQSTPFNLWSPQTDGSIVTIGGLSSGDLSAGAASFSDNGKLLSAPVLDENVSLPQGWIDESIGSVYNYTITEIYRLPENRSMLAIGVNANNSEGVVLKSMNSGISWVRHTAFRGGISQLTDAFVAVGFLNYANGIIAGHDGAIYCTTQGTSWDPFDAHPKGNTDVVKTYWAIDFIPEKGGTSKYGVIGLELESGEGAVWYTEDSADSFKEAVGVIGVPTSITHSGETYFMTTRGGHILKSTDKGATWAEAFKTGDGAELNRILFSEDNPQNGIALSYGRIYYTNDAGANWTLVGLPAMGMWGDANWADICWFDAETAYIAGDLGIYLTKDAGKTWEESHKLSKGKKLHAIEVEQISGNGVINAAGDEGQFSRKYFDETMSSYVAGTYDVENGIWTPLPTYGYASDGNMSSPFGISGDGKVILGQAYTYELVNEDSRIHSNATAWIDGKPIDLGNKFPNSRTRHTRAVVSNYDGSVIVGLQDIFGPWFATVWRKDTDGNYERKLMLKDSNKTEDDINYDPTTAGQADMMANLLGQARAISPDGKWIGGQGSNMTATDGAWIWSEETGVEEVTDDYGTVSGINNDASIVVGFYGAGTGTWIRTEKTGTMKLEKYLEKELGFDLQGYTIASLYRMSTNSRYLTGVCLKGASKYGYLVDLSGEGDVSTGLIEQINAAVYPNPVADELHIDVPFSNVETAFTLYDMQGRVVRTMTTTSVSNVMNVSDIASGLYILNVEADNARRAFKVEIR